MKWADSKTQICLESIMESTGNILKEREADMLAMPVLTLPIGLTKEMIEQEVSHTLDLMRALNWDSCTVYTSDPDSDVIVSEFTDEQKEQICQIARDWLQRNDTCARVEIGNDRDGDHIMLSLVGMSLFLSNQGWCY